MKCAWQELLSILPMKIRQDVDARGRDTLQEIRIRLGYPPMLVCVNGFIQIGRSTALEDLQYIVNTASRYSPWAAATIAQGFITAPGGHRIGICGQAVVQNGEMTGIRTAESLCIRVARDFTGLADKLKNLSGNILIIGPPGSGKTTFLRDLIRQKCKFGPAGVVDERGEIFPAGFERGQQVDVLHGTGKKVGISCLIRTMNPVTIAVDEITSEEDCVALSKAGWCGVDLLATAHAGSVAELKSRSVYRPILDQGLFEWAVVLRRDKSWHTERITL